MYEQAADYEATQAFRTALPEWLQTFNWDLFITITFATPRPPHNAITTLGGIARVIRRYSGGLLFLGTELHVNRTMHVHGLLECHLWSNKHVLSGLLWREFFNRYGRSDVSEVQSREAVTDYVSKYVTKALTEWLLE